MKYVGKWNLGLLSICSCMLFFFSCKIDAVKTIRNNAVSDSDKSIARAVAERVISSMKAGNYKELGWYLTDDDVISKLKEERNIDIAIDIDETSKLSDISFIQILTSSNDNFNYFYDTIEQHRFAYYFTPTDYDQFFYIFTLKENCGEHEIIFFLDFADVDGEWKLSNIELGYYKYNGMNGPEIGEIAMEVDIENDLLQSYLMFSATNMLLNPGRGRFVYADFQDKWKENMSKNVSIYKNQIRLNDTLYRNDNNYVEISGISVLFINCNLLPVYSCVTNMSKSDTALIRTVAQEVNDKIDYYHKGVINEANMIMYLFGNTPNDSEPVKLKLNTNKLDI